MNLTPSKKDRKKFDIDLAYGKVREDLIKEMLQDKKIEVKSERDVWKRTGNIAIEYQCYGKPSGINATEADYWFHNLCVGEDVYATLVFKTENLKKIIDSYLLLNIIFTIKIIILSKGAQGLFVLNLTGSICPTNSTSK